ncbi:elongator complex protein 4 isoform X1 [Pygocentrus nattereri]|uniref:elongator complex protein 4 isoform X1 n=1 Tax=Pygocentrus nattereri TaxID=42514 RepID=UPI00081496EB|nr:elongator complex protein 4 isoform X1 [Pygocentrus nattereri]
MMAAPVQTQACSSFRRSAGRAQLRGTRTTGRALLTTSSGVTGLDRALGGGLAVGSLLLIEEDQTDSYSRLLLQYFLAEGVVCGHQLYLASARDHPDDIIQNLPLPILDDDVTPKLGEPLPPADAQPPDPMKIAWRYQNFPKVQTEPVSSFRFGHYYDLSKRMDPQLLQATQFHTFYLPEETEERSSSLGPYSGLLQSIQTVIRNEGFDGSSSQGKVRNVLRLGVHSLGSALWGDDVCLSESPAHSHALTTFLYALRALLRSSLSVAVVTVPAHLIQSKSVLGRMVKLSDAVVALESFCSSERETSSVYREYHGLLHIRQVPHLNCLVCEVPDNKDLAFKLKRKQFSIEKLHLPPDLSETVSRVSKSKAEGSSGCGSAPSGHVQLDF